MSAFGRLIVDLALKAGPSVIQKLKEKREAKRARKAAKIQPMNRDI